MNLQKKSRILNLEAQLCLSRHVASLDLWPPGQTPVWLAPAHEPPAALPGQGDLPQWGAGRQLPTAGLHTPHKTTGGNQTVTSVTTS